MSDEPTRRNLVKWIIAGAIGIPISIEVGTFLGMVGSSAGSENSNALTPGDQLLPSTDSPETVRTLEVSEGEDGRALRLVADVTNEAKDPYEVAVSDVALDDGSTLSQSIATGRIEPGAQATLQGEWPLPAGATPVSIEVVARSYYHDSWSVVAATEHRIAPTTGGD
ncbi:MAG: hypothetical protein ABEJ74_08520 [Haloferacaceae archaeon]